MVRGWALKARSVVWLGLKGNYVQSIIGTTYGVWSDFGNRLNCLGNFPRFSKLAPQTSPS